MKFASVILDIPTAALETPYAYAVPETAEEQAQLAAAKSSAKMPAKKVMQTSFDDLLAEDPMQASPATYPPQAWCRQVMRREQVALASR